MDHTKKKLVFILLSILLGLGIYQHYFKISFENYKSLNKKYISKETFNKILILHSECFEPDKRKYLSRYFANLQEAKGATDQAIHPAFISNEVEAILQKGRLTKPKNFRHMKNVTIAKKNGRVLGLYNCNEENQITHSSIMIHNVCVAKESRGHGVGTALMKHAISKCYSKNRDLTLTVYQDQKKTISLYKKLGFKIVAIEKNPNDEFIMFQKFLMKYVRPI